jgi:hypothetical protein
MKLRGRAMTKDEYVNHEFVAQFIDWMSEKLDDETFAHAYTMRKWESALVVREPV